MGVREPMLIWEGKGWKEEIPSTQHAVKQNIIRSTEILKPDYD